jgi:hypothetical protein
MRLTAISNYYPEVDEKQSLEFFGTFVIILHVLELVISKIKS